MPNASDKLASQAMGVIKDAKATLKGLSGVFKHLMEEHGKVGALLKRLNSSSDLDVREQLYPTIRRELLSHEKGELVVVYPAFEAYPELAPIARRHAEEARELETAIGAIDRQPLHSAAWKHEFERLVALVDQHVEQEESEYFPKAQKLLGADRAKELLPLFETVKRTG